MTPELGYLTLSVVLLLAHIILQATWSDLTKGIGWALGPQDERREPSVVAARIERALANFLQTYPAFIALVVVTQMANDIDHTWTAFGAAVWFWACVAYVPAYASGLPLLRSIAWFASIAGLVMMLVPLVSG